MASARRTYDTDNITLRTVFAKNPDNTNVPALRTLTADGLGGAYWAIPSSLGGIPAYNQIITSAGSYTADLSFNKFRLLAGQNIGMSDGPAGSNQTTIYGKSFSQFDVSGDNTLLAFTGGVVTPTVKFAGEGGIQITSDPATNTLIFNGPSVIATVSTGIYGFNQIKVTPQNSTITSSVQGFGGDFITATSPSTLLRLLGYNDIQLSTNTTTNSVFFTISTFTSQGYLAMSNTAYAAYPSSISTVNALLTSSFVSSTTYFQSVNQVNLSSVYSSINGLAMSTGAEFFLLSGLINARATIIQLNSEISNVNTNIQSTSVGLGTLGYLSSGGAGAGVTDIELVSTFNQSLYLTKIALGYQAGFTSQDSYAVALGYVAGQFSQGNSAVAIAPYAGYDSQSNFAVALGFAAGFCNQTDYAVAIGNEAARSNQGNYGVAIGFKAGYDLQTTNAIAIGTTAGSNLQGDSAIAIGRLAGHDTQSGYSIAIGNLAGYSNQQSNAIAMGYNAGTSNQGSNSIAFGTQAGFSNQGDSAIAIGTFAGYDSQAPSSIVINGLASTLNAPNAGFYIAPLRDLTGIFSQPVVYDTTVSEVGTTQAMYISTLNVSSIQEPISSLTVNVNALWSSLYATFPACFA